MVFGKAGLPAQIHTVKPVKCTYVKQERAGRSTIVNWPYGSRYIP
jgi:hypothetical protein